MQLETVKTVALWTIICIAVLGVALAVAIRKITGKIISLVLAAVLIFIGWQQRSKVVNYAAEVRGQACDSADGAIANATPAAATRFLGIKVTLPPGWCS